jgi:3-oxoacyl-[acyl-carrier protein] reductase
MDLGLADKTVLITGASGGIGRALARTFAAEGAQLALHGHSRIDSLRAWAAEQDFAERSLVVAAEVGSPDAMQEAFDRARERFGRVDIAIANAGRWPSEDRPLHELDPERMRSVIETNLLGAAWTARAFMSSLAATGPRAEGHGASLLFIGSTAGRFGERGHCDYAASKAGLIGLALSLKNEVVALDPWARVNVLEPGWTVTEMTRREVSDPEVVRKVLSTMPLRQLARAVDIARVAVTLSSPVASRHVSGQVMTVAGGMEGRTLWEEEAIDPERARRRLDADGTYPLSGPG